MKLTFIRRDHGAGASPQRGLVARSRSQQRVITQNGSRRAILVLALIQLFHHSMLLREYVSYLNLLLLVRHREEVTLELRERWPYASYEV